jgi:hypothetical protein
MKEKTKEGMIRICYPFLISFPLTFLISEIFFINIGIHIIITLLIGFPIYHFTVDKIVNRLCKNPKVIV